MRVDLSEQAHQQAYPCHFKIADRVVYEVVAFKGFCKPCLNAPPMMYEDHLFLLLTGVSLHIRIKSLNLL
jgi:hypothetical protein